jgi:predicted transcriptional regulator
MTVTLHLNPELEKRLVALAAARGLSPEAYLVSVLETTTLPAVAENATSEQFEAAMDELAEGMDDVPVLAPEALSRESIYGNRA